MQRFSFDPDTRVEKTLKKTLASQAISTLMQLMQKLFDKLSLDISHQLSCNSYSRLTKTWELRKLSLQTRACQHSLTLMQLLSSIDQDIRVQKTVIQTLVFPLLCNSCSRLLGMRVEKTLSANSRFSTYMELLFLFDKSMGVKKLSYKILLVNCYQLSCNSYSRLTRT